MRELFAIASSHTLTRADLESRVFGRGDWIAPADRLFERDSRLPHARACRARSSPASAEIVELDLRRRSEPWQDERGTRNTSPSRHRV